MDFLGCVKCISCLCDALKALKMVKKTVTCVVIGFMIIIGITGMLENRDEIEKAIKKLKKKVM